MNGHRLFMDDTGFFDQRVGWFRRFWSASQYRSTWALDRRHRGRFFQIGITTKVLSAADLMNHLFGFEQALATLAAILKLARVLVSTTPTKHSGHLRKICSRS